MRFPGVRSPQEDHIRFLDFLIGVRPAACSENHRQTGDAWSVSGTVTTIDVVAPHDDTRELLRGKIHLVRRLRATEHSKGSGCAFIDCGLQTGGRAL
jgi:hypothetical protein